MSLVYFIIFSTDAPSSSISLAISMFRLILPSTLPSSHEVFTELAEVYSLFHATALRRNENTATFGTFGNYGFCYMYLPENLWQ